MKVKLLKKFRKIANKEFVLSQGIDCFFVEKRHYNLVFRNETWPKYLPYYKVFYSSRLKCDCLEVLRYSKNKLILKRLADYRRERRYKSLNDKDAFFFRDKTIDEALPE